MWWVVAVAVVAVAGSSSRRSSGSACAWKSGSWQWQWQWQQWQVAGSSQFTVRSSLSTQQPAASHQQAMSWTCCQLPMCCGFCLGFEDASCWELGSRGRGAPSTGHRACISSMPIPTAGSRALPPYPRPPWHVSLVNPAPLWLLDPEQAVAEHSQHHDRGRQHPQPVLPCLL
jgi:hypothetical protein